MIIGTASFFLEYKLTKLEGRVPAKRLTTIFFSKLSSVKCNVSVGPEGASRNTT